jgi:uncharacterized FlaG/YvyC family protein
MKKTELKSLIREEIKKTLNEKAILNAINPPLQGEVKQAVENLEKHLSSIGAILDYNHAQKLADLVIKIINAAKK